jgi:hypothetical protein
MATIVWDQIGERIYQSGVDRGVLYLHNGPAVPWNGLISIEESESPELKSFYQDGVKYLDNLSTEDFIGKLTAFTYPDEFDEVNGVAVVASGLSYHNQPAKSFNLAYRTRVGNDIEGIDFGYKIHILYNVIANPDNVVFSTIQGSEVGLISFGWTLTGTPPRIEKLRPTAHISIDSRKTPPDILTIVENKLYGTATSDPSLPSIEDISEYFGYLGALIIVDYGDGTWAAVDESDAYVTMLDDSTFQIEFADATYLDADSYTISSTNVGGGA